MKKSLYSEHGKRLQHWLRQHRQARQWSMRALAMRLDVPFQRIAKIENGERRLDLVEYVQYCRALEVDPQEGLNVVISSICSVESKDDLISEVVDRYATKPPATR